MDGQELQSLAEAHDAARDQTIGLVLAISSSIFIGSSFIVKKRGLRMAGSSGVRAGARGF